MGEIRFVDIGETCRMISSSGVQEKAIQKLYICCSLVEYGLYWARTVQGPVVQSIFSLTILLRGQLVKCFTTL